MNFSMMSSIKGYCQSKFIPIFYILIIVCVIFINYSLMKCWRLDFWMTVIFDIKLQHKLLYWYILNCIDLLMFSSMNTCCYIFVITLEAQKRKACFGCKDRFHIKEQIDQGCYWPKTHWWSSSVWPWCHCSH